MKNKLRVKGLGGKKTLSGNLFVSGSKNSALGAMASTILFKDKVVLTNIPRLTDIDTMINILCTLGCTVERRGTDVKVIPSVTKSSIPTTLMNNARASVLFIGPLLARLGSVDFSLPGGCDIGARPIDLFLSSYKKMMAKEVSEKGASRTRLMTEGKL